MTTIKDPQATESHLTDAEIAALSHPKQSPKVLIGMIASYVGICLLYTSPSPRDRS